MRTELAKKNGTRGKYTATYSRDGVKNGYNGDVPTVLLNDIRDASGKQVADHLWMVKGKQFSSLGLKVGDKVQFEARVDEYWKGYRGRRDDVFDKPMEKDYRLVYPTKFRTVKEEYKW